VCCNAPVVHLPVIGKAGLDLTKVGQSIIGGEPLPTFLLPATAGRERAGTRNSKCRHRHLRRPGLLRQPPASRSPARVAAPHRASAPPLKILRGMAASQAAQSAANMLPQLLGVPEVRRLMATSQGLTRQQVSWLPGRQRPGPLSRASWRLEGALVGQRRPGRLKTAADIQGMQCRWGRGEGSTWEPSTHPLKFG
jgi:hypothetical protein